jgi:glycosyltransferase involved in cell wall biosynthesis
VTGGHLRVLFVSYLVPTPPRFGAQARIHGLMTSLARRHELTGVALLAPDDDPEGARRAMASYCGELRLVPMRPPEGAGKRAWQLRSLASPRSYERRLTALPALRATLDDLLAHRRFDAINVEGCFLAHHLPRDASRTPRPPVVLDEHNIEYDLQRQEARSASGLLRRLYHSVNWRKVRREERAAWESADGVALTSAPDEARLRALLPVVRTAVIPNAVDPDLFRPARDGPTGDGRTLLFFGLMSYLPNADGVLHFLEEIWPRVAARHPRARLQIVGGGATAAVLKHQGPRVEISGLVPDVRPHLARAAAVIVPLRMGGGTRLKIIEAMSMGKAVVSTTVGAEGIAALHERELLIADEPEPFAAAVGRLLDDPALAHRIGLAGRALVRERYSWDAAARRLEDFYREVAAGAPARVAAPA